MIVGGVFGSEYLGKYLEFVDGCLVQIYEY